MVACDGIWEVHDSQEVVDYIHKDLYKDNFQKGGNDDIRIDPQFCDHLYDFLGEWTMAEDDDYEVCKGKGCDNMSAILIEFK